MPGLGRDRRVGVRNFPYVAAPRQLTGRSCTQGGPRLHILGARAPTLCDVRHLLDETIGHDRRIIKPVPRPFLAIVLRA